MVPQDVSDIRSLHLVIVYHLQLKVELIETQQSLKLIAFYLNVQYKEETREDDGIMNCKLHIDLNNRNRVQQRKVRYNCISCNNSTFCQFLIN